VPSDRAAARLLRQLAATPAGKACLPLPPATLDSAAAAGNIKACRWLLQTRTRVRWQDGAVWAAARAGHAYLTTWLLERGPERRVDVGRLLRAAAHGCSLLEMPRFL
jgi:hypothetical protein